MFGLGFPEIIIILIAFVAFFFGGKKLTEFARGMGRFTGEFKKGRMEIEKELGEIGEEIKETAPQKEAAKKNEVSARKRV